MKGDVEPRFGTFIKAKRMELGKTLRQFCLDNGMDPGNQSRLERGLIPPPQSREKLEELAALLKLKKASDDWYAFFDLAAAEKGRIPQDIMGDEKLVGKLPILFRTLRGKKIPDDKLDELAKRLREE